MNIQSEVLLHQYFQTSSEVLDELHQAKTQKEIFSLIIDQCKGDYMLSVYGSLAFQTDL